MFINSFVKNAIRKKMNNYILHKLSDEGCVKFDVGTSCLGPSKKILKIINKNLMSSLSEYPDPNYTDLKLAIAKKYKIRSENITVTSGADEAISLIPRVFLEPGENAIVAVPTFYRILESNHQFFVNNIFVSMDDDGFKMDRKYADKLLCETKKHKAKIVLLCNPNNPTGEIMKINTIEYLLKKIKKVLIVIDEAFCEFADSSMNYSSAHLVKKYKNLIVIGSLSKAYGLPGLRVGYIISDKKNIDTVNIMKPVFNVNELANYIAIEAINDQKHLIKTHKFIKEEKKYVIDSIKKMKKIQILGKSCTNVFLVRHKSKDLYKELRKRNIVVADFRRSPGLEGKCCVRITIKERNENDLLIKTLKMINAE